jgi:D-glycero-D-manno-heptose 1,7-bisphosphate phosphatase
LSHKAIFLDRDGVINRDTGYAHLPEQIEFLPGLFDFCRAAHAQGYMLIVITNQAGIARGFYSEETFHALMHWMEERFKKEGAPLSGYYFCPHHPDANCNCRKPKPAMILQAADEHDIDLAHSILIGDKQSDIEAGRTAGVGRLELFSGLWPLLSS